MLRKRWTPRTIFQRAGQVLQADGWRSLWFKIWGEVGYRRVALFVRDLEDAPLQPGSLTADELTDYLALRPDADAA